MLPSVLKRLSVLCAVILSQLPAPAQLQPSTVPSAVQQQLIDRRYGMFIHFGLNTYLDIEWGDGQAPVSVYQPTQLDCDQWVRVARDAGFRYVLLVTKHHDGFCLWDSQWTNYDVASTAVKTDVVRAVSDACRKYGLQFAVYYSLWDRHEPSYTGRKFGQYVDYMERQLTELMTQYGPVCELWLDGAWDKPVSAWQLPRLYRLVKRLQPDCAVGVNHTIASVDGQQTYTWSDLILPDSCNRDNRYYLRFFPTDFRLWDPKIAPHFDHKQYLFGGQSYYMPFEHTICLSRAWNWFSKSQPQPVRELDELEELYYWTTMNQNTLVVDVAPAPDGRIRPNEADAIIALAHRLGIRQGEPLPQRRLKDIVSYHAPAEATTEYPSDDHTYAASCATDGGMQTRWAAADGDLTPTLTLLLDSTLSFNRIALFEYQDEQRGADGFSNIRTGRIRRYTISLLPPGEDCWQPIYVGCDPLGDCKVIRLPRSYRASQLRLHIDEATAPPSLYEIELINQP